MRKISIKRIQAFEFCDQAWLPKSIRLAGMEYLAAALRFTKVYQPTAQVLSDLMQKSNQNRLIVLGAGSGGGILDVIDGLPPNTQIILTDLFPDEDFESSDPRVTYNPYPVDAFQVPKGLNGVRVLYTTFHHFSPPAAKNLLAAAVASRESVAIFEATERSVRGFLVTLLVPVLVLLVTPFMKPIRFSRFFWTYIIPVLPIGAFWDGVISTFRTYSVEEMKQMTSEFQDYEWDIRVLTGPHGEHVFSLTGCPRRRG